MKYTVLILENEDSFEERKLALVGEAWGGGETTSLQMQISQNGDDSFIDLDLNETENLYNHLKTWLITKGKIRE